MRQWVETHNPYGPTEKRGWFRCLCSPERLQLSFDGSCQFCDTADIGPLAPQELAEMAELRMEVGPKLSRFDWQPPKPIEPSPTDYCDCGHIRKQHREATFVTHKDGGPAVKSVSHWCVVHSCQCSGFHNTDPTLSDLASVSNDELEAAGHVYDTAVEEAQQKLLKRRAEYHIGCE